MILALETSTPEGSVAILEPGSDKILFDAHFHGGRSHSSQLFAVLEEALGVRSVKEVRQIVVGLGPGSYAGVRVAISAAIGLSVAAGAELLGLPSIVALDRGEYIALGDARRESFSFTRVNGGECVDGPRLLDEDGLRATLETLRQLPRYASEALHGVEGVEQRTPAASLLARYAARGGRYVTARHILEPIYLREPYITLPRPR